MKSLQALRAAMVAELEEISAHYKGIIDHLDALEDLRSPKATPAKKAPATPKRQRSLAEKVREVVHELSPQAFSITRVREMLPHENPKQVGQCVYLMAAKGELYKTGTDASGSSLYKEPA